MPADIVFQSLAKVQYQTARTKVFFFFLLTRFWVIIIWKATEKGWTSYLKNGQYKMQTAEMGDDLGNVIV